MKHLGRFSDRRKEAAYLRSLKGEEKYEALNEIIEQSKHIAFFGGAGVSTESGIPDFRSESGIFKSLEKYGDTPENLVSHTYYMDHTEEFFNYYKDNLIFKDAKPNPAHLKLSELEKIGKLKAVITQNIDGLHQKAGSCPGGTSSGAACLTA